MMQPLPPPSRLLLLPAGPLHLMAGNVHSLCLLTKDFRPRELALMIFRGSCKISSWHLLLLIVNIMRHSNSSIHRCPMPPTFARNLSQDPLENIHDPTTPPTLNPPSLLQFVRGVSDTLHLFPQLLLHRMYLLFRLCDPRDLSIDLLLLTRCYLKQKKLCPRRLLTLSIVFRAATLMHPHERRLLEGHYQPGAPALLIGQPCHLSLCLPCLSA